MILRSIGAALAVSLVGTAIITLGGGILAGGFAFSDLGWVFSVAVVPITAASLIIAVLGQRLRHTPWSMWTVAFIAAFAVVTVAAAAAAPIAQSMKFGTERVNMAGYVTWAPLYGIVLLPISAPLAYAVVTWLWTRPANKSFKRPPPVGGAA